MKAITFAGYGAPDVLTVSEVPLPEPGPGQVRVAVRSAGVNPIDWKIRSGAIQAFFPVPLPHTPGLELAGVVDVAGPDTDLSPGDEVFGWSDTGAYAEYALATVLARRPAGLSWPDAASLPIAGAAAVRDLEALAVLAGETLLILGAGGTTGRFAAQVAVARGATVIGVAGARHHDDLRALGVRPVSYDDGWTGRVREAAGAPIDAVYDTAGHGLLHGAVELRGGPERIITIADPATAGALGVANATGGEQSRAVLDEVARWVTERGVRIVHAGAYPLADAAAAHTASESGRPGKLTLRP
ncbi:NADP-dependent oxidoreductase [Catenuloplanes sp. NPDC051500]|uniref:NADP-dependent oxidoreductase n=1 Tax=Catenuloplanes sp. NPDC051500 TaxID=3363959 RepID=UPI0037991BD9